MKKWAMPILIALLALGVILAGCGDKKDGSPGNGNENNAAAEDDLVHAKGNPDLEAKLTVWAIAPDFFEAVIPAFKQYFPKVDVEIVNMGFDVIPKTQTAIAAGKGGPDIVYYHYNWQADFLATGGLEDLLQPPYNAGQYEPYFAEAAWQRMLTVDGKKLIGFPQDIVPYTMAYREDIIEDYGYPTDPDELAEYLADEDNYINMALTFKPEDRYIMQMTASDLHFMPNEGFFDRELNYSKNNETTIRFVEVMQRAHQLGLIPNIWVVFDPNGNQAVDTGRLILLRADVNTGNYIKEYAPNTVGKWKMARMPLNGNNAGQGLAAAILSQSKNKEAAWEFIRFAMATIEGQTAAKEAGILGFPGFKPMWEQPGFLEEENEVFGGQRINELAIELIREAPITITTPFDKVAASIFDPAIEDAIVNQKDVRAVLQKVENDTMAAISQDLEKYKAAMETQ